MLVNNYRKLIDNTFPYLKKLKPQRYHFDAKHLYLEEIERRQQLECNYFKISISEWLGILRGQYRREINKASNADLLYGLITSTGRFDYLNNLTEAAKKVAIRLIIENQDLTTLEKLFEENVDLRSWGINQSFLIAVKNGGYFIVNYFLQQTKVLLNSRTIDEARLLTCEFEDNNIQLLLTFERVNEIRIQQIENALKEKQLASYVVAERCKALANFIVKYYAMDFSFVNKSHILLLAVIYNDIELLIEIQTQLEEVPKYGEEAGIYMNVALLVAIWQQHYDLVESLLNDAAIVESINEGFGHFAKTLIKLQIHRPSQQNTKLYCNEEIDSSEEAVSNEEIDSDDEVVSDDTTVYFNENLEAANSEQAVVKRIHEKLESLFPLSFSFGHINRYSEVILNTLVEKRAFIAIKYLYPILAEHLGVDVKLKVIKRMIASDAIVRPNDIIKWLINECHHVFSAIQLNEIMKVAKMHQADFIVTHLKSQVFIYANGIVTQFQQFSLSKSSCLAREQGIYKAQRCLN